MEGKTTRDIFCHDGIYNRERKELHESIIEKILPKDEHSQFNLEAIIIGGSAGSGKSSVILEAIGDTDGMVQIDADLIKENLPEYKSSSLGAEIVHDESSDIVRTLLERCISERRSFIYDGTMKNEKKYRRLFKELNATGYEIEVVFVDVDVEIAMERVQLRFQKEENGRFVPPEVVENSNKRAPVTFLKLKNYMDSYSVFRNNENNSPPKLIIAKYDSNSKEVINNYEEYIQFIKKGLQ